MNLRLAENFIATVSLVSNLENYQVAGIRNEIAHEMPNPNLRCLAREQIGRSRPKSSGLEWQNLNVEGAMRLT
jgi:hypothetical protein